LRKSFQSNRGKQNARPVLSRITAPPPRPIQALIPKAKIKTERGEIIFPG
jgi:uncharacterized protein YggT (Ycf19 family)